MKDYPDELEADLLEFFGVDVLDFWSGRLSLRRIAVLINSLLHKPGKSVLLQAMDEKTRWDEPTYLLARNSDALELSNYLFLKANSTNADDLDPPAPIPRPGEMEPEPEDTEMSSPQEVMDLFRTMNSL
ncbi:hypothetical protein ACFRCI_17275 [Streptomyces sp. NPDC056638]|uniref:hypothetical protein n=1 Tax=Streptomyces sp. NPDC056638 TaxID=3345887 RepID=UPI00368E2C06